MSERNRIAAPASIDLRDYDPDDTGGMSREEAEARLPRLEKRLQRLQELLYAAGRQSVLVVLQGLDTSGKDGTVKHVMSSLNPTGCQVWNFKVPSAEELSHDFLWRVHQRTPARGVLAIFNRSHYEDVLVARVHKLVPHDVWRERYAQINAFERLLAQNDTIVLKFFLHITKDEQERRLLAREQDADKAWKLSVADWQERAFWPAYQEAYQDALGTCAADWAPWFVVPANHKWYRNDFVAHTLVQELERHEGEWLRELEQRGKQELAALRAVHAEEGGERQKRKDKHKHVDA